jgi:DNA modification methylase
MQIEKYLNQIHYCDCLEFMKKLPDDCVDMVLTDIPYGDVNEKKGHNQIRNFDKKDADILTFDLRDFFYECLRICKGSGYIFCGYGQVSIMTDILKNNKIAHKLCVWDKTNPSPINGEHIWLNGLEFCIFWKNKNATFNEFCKKPLWKFSSGKSKIHPTEKPLKLFEYLVSVSSNRNDIVADFCLGSGTTAIACERLGRQWLGCEISKEYCDIANARIEAERRQLKLPISI